MADYFMADGPNDPATVAEKIIDQYHPHLKGLAIAYTFKVTAPKKIKPGGRVKKVTMAKTSKIAESIKPLLARPYEFKIEFDAMIWEELGETPGKREALVDHELCHCGNDADGVYLVPHTVEEISEVVTRHGIWKSDLAQFAEAVDAALHPVKAAQATATGLITEDELSEYVDPNSDLYIESEGDPLNEQ